MARRRGHPPNGEITQRTIRRAYESLLARSWAGTTEEDSALGGLRDLVRESWHRSLVHLPQPDRVRAALVWSDEELRAYRDRHCLAAVLPVIQRLLVEPSAESGVVVAVGDEHGRLLWVDGDRSTLAKTDRLTLVPGADWSENAMGTSAPGTALVVAGSVQITGAEHFVPAVQRWNCTAVPIRDPGGRILGVIDVTGGDHAVGPLTLAWVRAAVEAVEAVLRESRRPAREGVPGRGDPGGTAVFVPRGSAIFAPGGPVDIEPHERDVATLSLLGRRSGLLRVGERALELSLRHSEILTLLAGTVGGLTLDGLAEQLDPHLSAVTLRAEISRLRRVLDVAGMPDLVPASRPYRLPAPLEVDAQTMFGLVARGHLDRAVREYGGAVLPASGAPGIVRLRERLRAALREAVLGDGSLPVVLDYLELPDAQDDVDAWTCALRLLPPASPRRAVVVAHLDQLEAELR